MDNAEFMRQTMLKLKETLNLDEAGFNAKMDDFLQKNEKIREALEEAKLKGLELTDEQLHALFQKNGILDENGEVEADFQTITHALQEATAGQNSDGS